MGRRQERKKRAQREAWAAVLRDSEVERDRGHKVRKTQKERDSVRKS